MEKKRGRQKTSNESLKKNPNLSRELSSGILRFEERRLNAETKLVCQKKENDRRKKGKRETYKECAELSMFVTRVFLCSGLVDHFLPFQGAKLLQHRL